MKKYIFPKNTSNPYWKRGLFFEARARPIFYECYRNIMKSISVNLICCFDKKQQMHYIFCCFDKKQQKYGFGGSRQKTQDLLFFCRSNKFNLQKLTLWYFYNTSKILGARARQRFKFGGEQWKKSIFWGIFGVSCDFLPQNLEGWRARVRPIF